MKRTILSLLVIFSLLLAAGALAEGEQPAVNEKAAALSLGDYLHCYPDQEITGEDGSVTEVFSGISLETQDAFLSFLTKQQGKLGSRVFASGSDYVYQKDNGEPLYDDLSHYEVEGQTPIHYVVIKFNADQVVIHFRYDTESEEARVIYPAGTYDKRTRNAREQYDSIVALMGEGKIDEAVQAYRKIEDPTRYAPVAEYVAAHKDLATAISKFRFEVKGEYVSFGRYEQGNDPANGPEEIEWLVLDVRDGKSLLISRYALDSIPYNDTYQDVTWETSSIRAWLNGDFYSAAFDASEQTAILKAETDNSAAMGSAYPTDGGSNTEDSVFLLSYSEAFSEMYGSRLFAGDEARKCTPTAYALSRGAWVSPDDGSCGWWLRSPGSLPSCAMRVSSDGSERSAFVDYDEPAVRPAIWIDLGSDFF